MKLSAGDRAPEFALPDQNGKVHKLSASKGKWRILYFYPKDDTPGCTKEACAFRDNQTKLKRLGAVILGVSVDPVEKHKKFVDKYELPFTLLSDADKNVVREYGVWGKKKFMGREYMGTNRVSFLIDPRGRIAKVYPKVKPAEHAEEIARDLRELAE
jgi:peroxiredoxin Q/BCP